MEKKFSQLRSQLEDSLSVFYKGNELGKYEKKKSHYVDIKANSYFLYSLYCMQYQGKTKEQLAFYFDRRLYFIFAFEGVGEGEPHLRELKEEGVYVKGEKALLLTAKVGKTGHILPFQLNKYRGRNTFELFYHGYPMHPRNCLGQGEIIKKYFNDHSATIPLEEAFGEKTPLKRFN